MNTATDTTNALRNRALADAMATARDAIRSLEQLGIMVITVTASARRPTLFVDRMPDGVMCVTKRHSPTGTGREVIRATQWQGCQLEAMHVEIRALPDALPDGSLSRSTAARVATLMAKDNGISMPRLQVVHRD